MMSIRYDIFFYLNFGNVFLNLFSTGNIGPPGVGGCQGPKGNQGRDGIPGHPGQNGEIGKISSRKPLNDSTTLLNIS